MDVAVHRLLDCLVPRILLPSARPLGGPPDACWRDEVLCGTHDGARPALQLTFVAEALVVGQAFARAMGCAETGKLDFSFRWTRLRDRTLVSLLRPSRLLIYQRHSTDNDAVGGCFLPLDTASSAIFQYVQQATKPLFHRFDGLELPSNWVQRVVDEFLERRNY